MYTAKINQLAVLRPVEGEFSMIIVQDEAGIPESWGSAGAMLS